MTAVLLLSIYWIFFVSIAVAKRSQLKTYEDFTVAGRRQTTTAVWFSILATCIGSSVVIGLPSSAASTGWPAFWWLAVGSIGLMLQGLLLTEKVRQSNATTIIELIQNLTHPSIALAAAFVIVISWVGIVAAQFKAMGVIFQSLVGITDPRLFTMVGAIATIFYTMIGGQLSVFATDKWQFLILLGSIFVPFFAWFGDKSFHQTTFEFLNDKFTVRNLLEYVFLTGAAYFVGPDMFSRVLCAKDAKKAKNAIFLSAISLVPIAIAITWLGVKTPEVAPGSGAVLLRMIEKKLGKIGLLIGSFGLLSAVISSADTTLLTASTIIQNDILKKKDSKAIQIWIAVVGTFSLLIALGRLNIIPLLLNVYSLYVPAIVPITTVLLMENKKVEKPILLVPFLVGVSFGILSLLFNNKMYSIIGFVINFLISWITLKMVK
ncbi:sodium:solute symporter family protein [Pseudothermotoga thermarum]|uniref:Na+/solute symporter n=1 Tax=Pseudothermotoga thermarum DSM 5069 TaxID=688269 RepID=F7YVA0_9THEM|nr:Na+/solute symporter [Pseudothermotoga thermarum]AEH50403.1 Na+/solute symporter [Pseudothermotoga thermarum DSM 5069]